MLEALSVLVITKHVGTWLAYSFYIDSLIDPSELPPELVFYICKHELCKKDCKLL